MTRTIEVAAIDEMVDAGTLTHRQGEVLACLAEGKNVVETAEQLDVSRNAVYGQIAAMKGRGILPEGYTPKGELRVIPRDPRERPVRVPENASNETVESHLMVIRELVTQQRLLLETIREQATIIADLTEKNSD